MKTYLRSAKPPPEAQLSLNGRLVFGMSVPLSEMAFCAAAVSLKSTKQYPALLSPLSARPPFACTRERDSPRELVSNHLDIHLFTEIEPDLSHESFVDPWLQFTHPIDRVRRLYELSRSGCRSHTRGWSSRPCSRFHSGCRQWPAG